MSDCSRDSITITLPGWDDTPGAEDSIYISSGSDTVTLSDLSYSSGASITGITVPWVTTTSISDNSYTSDHNWSNGTSAKIKLDGPEADIEINGESLIDMLRNIEQRLNILKPNKKLESEWAELRELGNQYRTLEAQIQTKMKIWNAIAK
jgi:hypothetical protein